MIRLDLSDTIGLQTGLTAEPAGISEIRRESISLSTQAKVPFDHNYNVKMSSDPTDTLGLSCPNGGHFYVCQDSDIQFLGCCTSDPCADGSGICPQEDLRYSSFDADGYKNITAQSCSGKGKWFTCAGLYTPFLGCCSSDACSYDDGCPTKSLQAAELSSNIKDAAIFETASATAESATPSTDPSVSSTMTPSTTSLASISTPANTAAPVRGSSSPGLSKGAIAGVSIACALFLIASTVALLFLRRRRWGNRKGVVGQMSESPLHTAMTRDPANSSLDHGMSITSTRRRNKATDSRSLTRSS